MRSLWQRTQYACTTASESSLDVAPMAYAALLPGPASGASVTIKRPANNIAETT